MIYLDTFTVVELITSLGKLSGARGKEGDKEKRKGGVSRIIPAATITEDLEALSGSAYLHYCHAVQCPPHSHH